MENEPIASPPSPRTLYHLRRVDRLTRQLKRLAVDDPSVEGLKSRINHHRAKAKELARAD